MLAALFQFIFTTLLSFLGVVLILRAWLYYWAMSPRHPLSQACYSLTQWLTEPLARLVPKKAGFDWPSLIGALFIAVLTVISNRVFEGIPISVLGWVLAPIATLVTWALDMISWGTIAWVIMSWINPTAPITYTLLTLLEVFIRPIRRVIPVFKGIDFSPFVLILLINILMMFVMPISHGLV